MKHWFYNEGKVLRAFSLPELLVVLVIIGILVLIAVIGKYEYSEIGKKRYLKNGNNDAVKTATSMQ